MKIIVTGGVGFVGCNAVATIVAFDRVPPKRNQFDA
jgi:nucleoside-diphosphate-sugar epimerase